MVNLVGNPALEARVFETEAAANEGPTRCLATRPVGVNMKKTNAAQLAATDPRTSCAIACDETLSWLAERVPDRVPLDVDSRVLAHPSFLSAVASEYSRRLQRELAGSPEYREQRLDELLDALPRKLLAYNPSETELAGLRSKIDAAVSLLRNPPAVKPLSSWWQAVALDLGVKLPVATHERDTATVRSTAEERIHAELANERRSGKRGGAREKLMLAYRRRLLIDEHEPRTLDEKRAAYALAGAKWIPAVLSTGPYAATEEELRATTKPRVPAVHIHGPEVDRGNPNAATSHSFVMQPPRHPDYFKRLVAALGEVVDDEKQSSSIEVEVAALRAKRAERGFANNRDENEHAFALAIEKLVAARRLEWSKTADTWTRNASEQQGRVLAALDATLAKLPIGPAWYFTQNARDAVAAWSADDGGAVEGMQLFNVTLEGAS